MHYLLSAFKKIFLATQTDNTTRYEVRNEEEEQREEEEDSETEDPSWSPEETLKAYEEFGDDVDTDTKPR